MKRASDQNFTAAIGRRQGRNFVLIFPNDQELIVPVHCFSATVRTGDVIHLQFLTDKQARAGKAELARHILEEILNGRD